MRDGGLGLEQPRGNHLADVAELDVAERAGLGARAARANSAQVCGLRWVIAKPVNSQPILIGKRELQAFAANLQLTRKPCHGLKGAPRDPNTMGDGNRKLSVAGERVLRHILFLA